MKKSLIMGWLVALVAAQTTLVARGQYHYPGPTLGAGGGGIANAYEVMRAAKVQLARVSTYPWDYFDEASKTAKPQSFDSLVVRCQRNGLDAYILCEQNVKLNGDGSLDLNWWNQVRGYDDWYKVGRALAERFRPNSPWLRARGITNWGVKEYSAFNEPDFTLDGARYPALLGDYVSGIKGFADGVHSVDAALRVIPGGFAYHNAYNDWTLRGLGPALAPLWNDGTLQGIDLHDYFGGYTPPFANYKTNNGGQRYFDLVKQKSGINKDILFYCTELNGYAFDKENPAISDQDDAARKFLTLLWDHLGVVGNDGKTPVTGAVMPFSIFLTDQDNPNLADLWLHTQVTPTWVPNQRGRVLQSVGTLVAGMYYVTLDPRGSGTFVLNGNNRKMWVWQNWDNWSTQAGTSFQVTGIPAAATKLDVYDWTGLVRTIPLTPGLGACAVANLAKGNTFMLVANAQDGAAPPPPPPAPPAPPAGPAGAQGAVVRETWTGISGEAVAAIPTSTPPTNGALLNQLEIAVSQGDNYGTRIRGYITPTSSDSYTFYLAGDDNCELWLSPGEEPAQKARLAQVPGWTNLREWGKYAAQQSAPVPLVAGRRYYFEVLQKEGGGGDHVSVGWTTPGGSGIAVVPGSVLSPYNPFSGPYAVRAKHSGKVLDIPDASPAAGVAVQQYRATGGRNQQWELQPATVAGYYTLRVASSQLLLDVAYASTANGAAVQQYTPNGTAAQDWLVLPVGGGYYQLLSRPSGKALTVGDAAQTDGAAIVQQDYAGGDNQRWQLAATENVAAARAGAAEAAAGSRPPALAGALFPNPATADVSLRYQARAAGHCQLVVRDNLGRPVYQLSVPVAAGDNLLRLPLPTTLRSGVHMVSATGPGAPPQTFKLLIIR